MAYENVVGVGPRAPLGYVDEQFFVGNMRGAAGADYVQGMPPMQSGGFYPPQQQQWGPPPQAYYGAPPQQFFDGPPQRYWDAPPPQQWGPPPQQQYWDAPRGPSPYGPSPYDYPPIIPQGPSGRGGDVYYQGGQGGPSGPVFFDRGPPISQDQFIRKPAAGERLDVTVHDPDKPKPSILKVAFKDGTNTVATLVGVGGFLAFWAGAASMIFGTHSIGGVGHVPSLGAGGPGVMMVGGAAAMLGAGAIWHWNNPKDK